MGNYENLLSGIIATILLFTINPLKDHLGYAYIDLTLSLFCFAAASILIYIRSENNKTQNELIFLCGFYWNCLWRKTIWCHIWSHHICYIDSEKETYRHFLFLAWQQFLVAFIGMCVVFDLW